VAVKRRTNPTTGKIIPVVRRRLIAVVTHVRSKRMGLFYTFYRQKRIPPSPGGEGRDEGELKNQLFCL
jgi:hypothetical protein